MALTSLSSNDLPVWQRLFAQGNAALVVWSLEDQWPLLSATPTFYHWCGVTDTSAPLYLAQLLGQDCLHYIQHHLQTSAEAQLLVDTLLLKPETAKARPVTAHLLRTTEPGGQPQVWAYLSDLSEGCEASEFSRLEMRHRLLVQASQEGIWEWDLVSNATYYSSQWARLLGYQSEQLSPCIQVWEQAIHPDDREAVDQALQAHLEGKQAIYESVHRLRHRAGHYIWVLERGLVDHSANRQPPQRLLVCSLDISSQKQAEQGIRESEQRYRGLIEMSPDAILVQSDTRILYANPAAAEIFAAPHARELIGREVTALNLPSQNYWSEVQPKLLHALIEYPLTRLDGVSFIAEATASAVNYLGSQATQVIVRDITQRKHQEQMMELAHTVFRASSEALMITDKDNRIIEVNPAFTKITGYSRAEALGKNPAFLSSGQQGPEFYQQMWRSICSLGTWSGEIQNLKKSGELYVEWLSIATITDTHNNIVQHVAVFSDITERKQAEELIQWQANYDGLTSLPNRSLFRERLQYTLVQSLRKGGQFALLFIDLDRFKLVNDTMGHEVGDLLLQETAQRLVDVVRESDTVARLGGDEFTIILPEIQTADDAVVVARHVLETLTQPFTLEGKQVYISASIGLTFYPEDGRDSQTLIKHADVAMYRAKEAGRSGYALYDPEMDAQTLHKVKVENALRQALQRDELCLYVQPIVDLASAQVSSVEVLLRWQHPQLGLVGPGEFIPIAEESSLISDIGLWLLDQVDTLLDIFEDHPSLRKLRISVNLSSRQFKRQEELALMTEKILAMDGQRLTLEMTEGLLLDDTEAVLGFMQRMKQHGALLALDDFGTGYSSLSYLQRFPFDLVKIDRAFINKLLCADSDQALVTAILAMASSLNLQVVAEGVESQPQYEFLQDKGCAFIQGYYIGRPQPVDDFILWLHHGSAHRATTC